MKYILTVLAITLSLFVLAQGPSFNLQEEQQKLAVLEGELSLLDDQLTYQGIKAKKDYRYIELEGRIKTQKAIVKEAKKRSKNQGKSKTVATNPQVVSSPATTAQPTMNNTGSINKDAIASKKEELKNLKRAMKLKRKQLKAAGMDADSNDVLFAMTNRMAQLEMELDGLKNGGQVNSSNQQVIERPVPTATPNPVSRPRPQQIVVSESDVELKKQEWKRLKTEKKDLRKQLVAQGIDPYNDDRIVALDVAIAEAKLDLDLAKENAKNGVQQPVQPRPVSTATPRPKNTTTPPQAQRPQVQVQPSVSPSEIEMTKVEWKRLKKQKKDLKKQLSAQGIDPALDQRMLNLDVAIAEAKLNMDLAKESAKFTPSQPVMVDPVPQQGVYVEGQPVAYSPPVIGLNTILFNRLSAEIDPSYSEYLDVVAYQLRNNPVLRLQVDTYTDNTEKGRLALQLSASMAANVRNAFLQRGINPERLVLNPQGSKRPIADNDTLLGQARNRRAELSFL